MADSQRKRVEALFQAALDLPVDKRRAFLDRECGPADSLRAEVERLLEVEARSVGDLPSIGMGPELALATALERATPDKIGPYGIVRLIGEGGMGLVYEARQAQPRRTVALKVVRPGLANRNLLRRFEQEAEVLGQLQHPGIAHIYDAGVAEILLDTGPAHLPFFAMEYVDGASLDRHARDRALGTRQRLELVARICDAVQHAHQKGVIHRDLKPGNILVDSSGQPRILDFGVARVTESDLQTMTMQGSVGQLLGTIPYMSPEQVLGDSKQLDTRSDVYALGVILFELLAEKLPNDVGACSIPEAARIIREEEPSRLSSINSTFRGDVETIASKALEKDRERRYASAAEMGSDIRRYLRDEPIVARPASTYYQLCKFAKRNKVLVGGATATILALFLGLIFTATFARREARQRRIAEQNAEDAHWMAYSSSLDAASSSLQIGFRNAAFESLARAPEPLRGWVWAALAHQADQSLVSWQAHESGVYHVVHDGRTLLTAAADGVVSQWDVETRTRTSRIEAHSSEVKSLSPSPGGVLLLTSRLGPPTADKGVRGIDELAMWRRDTGELQWRRSVDGSVGRLPFLPDGSLVAVGRRGAFAIALLDPQTGEDVGSVPIADATAHGPSFSHDGRRLVFSGPGVNTVMIDFESRQPIWSTAGGAWPSFTPDDTGVLAASGDSRTILFLDAGTGALLGEITDEGRWLGSRFRVGSDRRVFAANSGHGLTVWDRTTTDLVERLFGHVAPLVAVSVSPDGSRVAAGSVDGAVKIWDAATTATPMLVVYPPDQISTRGAISPDGRTLATADWGHLKVWDVGTGAELWSRFTLPPQVASLAFDPEGERVAFAAKDDSLSVVASDGIRQRLELPEDAGSAVAMVWSPGGDRLYAACNDGVIRIFDTVRGRVSAELEAPGHRSGRLALSSEGTTLASGADGVWLWETASGRLLYELPANGNAVSAITLDAAGGRLAVGRVDGELEIVDTGDGRRLGGGSSTLPLTALAFTPDGTRIAAGLSSGAVRFWTVDEVREIATVQTARRQRVSNRLAGPGTVLDLVFTQDGATLVVAGVKGFSVVETKGPAGGYGARARAQAARRMVDDLFERLVFSEAVVEHLRADTSVADPLRQQAIGIARARGDHLRRLNSDAILAYRKSGETRAAMELPLKKIQLVNRRSPGVAGYVSNLGKLQVRSGLHRDALATFVRADELYQAAGTTAPAQDWAFVAMARQALGDRQGARSALAHARSRSANAVDDWTVTFIREVEALIGGSDRSSADDPAPMLAGD